MGLLKYVLVAAFAASAAFGVTATRGEASHPVDARLVVVQPGVLVQVPGIDLSPAACIDTTLITTKSGHSCTATRTSAPRSSRGIGVSMWHYFVSSGGGKLRVLRVTRSP